MAASSPSARSTTAALWILAIIAVLFFLRAASQLLIPIALAVLFSYVLEPIVRALERLHLPRILAASVLMLALLGVFGLGLYSLRDDVIEATEALPTAARRAREMLESQGASGPAANIRKAMNELTSAGAPSPQTQPETRGTTGTRESESGPLAPEPKSGADQQNAGAGSADSASSNVTGLLQQGLGSFFAMTGHFVTIVFLTFFLLLTGAPLRDRLVDIAEARVDRRKMAAILDDINAKIQRFLLVTAFTAAVVAVATWAVLGWMGVRQAAVWGILAGVFNSIPYFGPVIVSGGLLTVGLVQTGSLADALKICGAALAITSLEGWLLTPPLMGKAERMSALVVFLGLLVWTWIWGGWGTILAVPMLVILKSVADHVDSMKPLSRLMSH